MTKKAFVGAIFVAPSSKINVSDEAESQVKSSYSDQNYGASSKFIQSYKEGDFEDKHGGKSGSKQEAKYTSTDKYVEKTHGFATEYKTQLKVTKSVYIKKSDAPQSKSSYKRLTYY